MSSNKEIRKWTWQYKEYSHFAYEKEKFSTLTSEIKYLCRLLG